MRGANGFRSGGTRGGQAEFKWEDVKSDKYRECYLGHSVNASVGRWQKHKDLQWYTRSHPGARASVAAEIAREQRAARERDEDLLNQQLGIAPKRRRKEPADAESGASLDAAEMKELLARGGMERDSRDADRIGGIGTDETKRHEHVERKTLAQQYQDELGKIALASASTPAGPSAAPPADRDDLCHSRSATSHDARGLGSEDAATGLDSRCSAETDRRSDRRARKEAKKARKKERKQRKKAKKERKKRKREAKAVQKRSKIRSTDDLEGEYVGEVQSNAVGASQRDTNNATASAARHRRKTRWDVESKEGMGNVQQSCSHSRSRSRSGSGSCTRSRLDSFQSSSAASSDSDSASSGSIG